MSDDSNREEVEAKYEVGWLTRESAALKEEKEFLMDACPRGLLLPANAAIAGREELWWTLEAVRAASIGRVVEARGGPSREAPCWKHIQV